MEMRISRENLRRRILAEPDISVESGLPVALLEQIGILLPAEEPVLKLDTVVPETRKAWSILVRLLRKEEGLTIDQLAAQVRVDARELEALEHDLHATARPRTVHQLANHYRLPATQLMKLSGLALTSDVGLHEEAHRFAAKADAIGTLTQEERDLLQQFVQLVVARGDR